MRTWLKVHLGGQVWTVRLVSPRSKKLIDAKGELVVGRTWVERCEICIADTLDAQAREDTLLHELLHALFYVVGAFGVLQGFHAGDVDAAQASEDAIVHPLTPVLHRLLKDLGFHFPKV